MIPSTTNDQAEHFLIQVNQFASSGPIEVKLSPRGEASMETDSSCAQRTALVAGKFFLGVTLLTVGWSIVGVTAAGGATLGLDWTLLHKSTVSPELSNGLIRTIGTPVMFGGVARGILKMFRIGLTNPQVPLETFLASLF